jgi:hypothetical protein
VTKARPTEPGLVWLCVCVSCRVYAVRSGVPAMHGHRSPRKRFTVCYEFICQIKAQR